MILKEPIFLSSKLPTWLYTLLGGWLVVLAPSLESTAQGTDYARHLVDTLTSASFWGRGYVNHGHELAAQYLAKEFEYIGLKPLTSIPNYLQPFPLNVNTFPTETHLQVNKQKLKEGFDYILVPTSLGAKSKRKAVLNATLTGKDSVNASEDLWESKKIVVVHAAPAELRKEQRLLVNRLVQNAPCQAVVELCDKLLWTVADTAYTKPHFMVRKEAIANKPIKKIRYDFETKLTTVTSNNVVGYIRGAQQPDSFLVVGAHYDHLGMMGKARFCGANDNASGVALLLELAKHFTQNTPNYSMIFIAFGAEEAGLVGSSYFVQNPPIPMASIRFMLNLDLMATGEKGITLVNATSHAKEYDYMVQANQTTHHLSKIGERSNASNSDHYPFTQKNVPAFFAYAEGDWTAYHDVNDCTPIPFSRYETLLNLFSDFLRWLQQSD